MSSQLVPSWIGLVPLGSLVIGCSSDDGGDELGEAGSTTAASSSETSGSETSGSESDTSTTDTGTTGEAGLELVAAELTNGAATLVLTFSDEVAPIDGVDPMDFRLSYAWTYSVMYANTYEASYYTDPNYGSGMTVEMVGISQGPNPDQISLELAPAVDLGICSIIEAYKDGINQPVEMGDAGLFPHYSPGATALTSVDGLALAPIGPDWVEYAGDQLKIDEYHWPYLQPLVFVPCIP